MPAHARRSAAAGAGADGTGWRGAHRTARARRRGGPGLSAPAALPVWQARVEKALQALFKVPPAEDPAHRLFAAMRYSLLAGGKRLRPVLCLATVEALGGARAEPADVDRVCSAIECIHTYSLIHDDLPAMDDDALRRGMPTCHRAFDEATAILAGDGLQALAFELLAAATSVPDAARVGLVATLAGASGAHGMVGGQAIDLACVGHTLARPALERMHALKTGALIRASVRMGALLAGADAAALARLDEYATALGLAFQVHDDVLDQTGTVARLGKEPGVDAAHGKPTFVSLLGLDAAGRLANDLEQRACAALAPFDAVAEPLRELARFAVRRDH